MTASELAGGTSGVGVAERVSPREPAARDDPARPRSTSWPAVALIAVAAAHAAATISKGMHVPLGRDEVVYASQVSRGHEPAFFSAPRARGITWIAAPWLQTTDAVPSLRIYLGLMSAVGLVLAFWPWLRVRGLTSPWVVPAASALFASLWLSIFYGNAVMPNLWVAYGCLAATGFLLRRAQGGGLGDLLGLAASIGFVTLVRPTDGALLTALLAMAAAVCMRFRAVLPVLLASAAFVVASIPWVVEANARFGGVLGRLRSASTTEGGFLGAPSLLELRVVAGPLLCRPTCRAAHEPLPVNGLIWWAAWATLAVVAAVLAGQRGKSSVVLLPAWVGLGMAAPYVVAVGYAAPRFLHPAYGQLTIAVAEGVFALGVRARRTGPAWTILMVASFAVFAGNQAHIASRIADHEGAKRGAQLRVANELRADGIRPGCMISGAGAPVIAYALRCQSSAVSGHDENITREELAAMAKHQQVLLLRPAGTTLNPPRWGGDAWQEGYSAPERTKRSLWIVFLPVDARGASAGRP